MRHSAPAASVRVGRARAPPDATDSNRRHSARRDGCSAVSMHRRGRPRENTAPKRNNGSAASAGAEAECAIPIAASAWQRATAEGAARDVASNMRKKDGRLFCATTFALRSVDDDTDRGQASHFRSTGDTATRTETRQTPVAELSVPRERWRARIRTRRANRRTRGRSSRARQTTCRAHVRPRSTG